MHAGVSDTEKHAARNRLRWQCRRGMRELDELLKQFLQSCYEDLDRAEIDSFETLLEYPDALLLEFLMGRMTPTDTEVARIVRKIRDASAA